MIPAIYARKSTDQNSPDGGKRGNNGDHIPRRHHARPGLLHQSPSWGLRFGVISYTIGVYRFYVGDEETLGGPDLQDEDLDRLKTAIRSRYGSA